MSVVRRKRVLLVEDSDDDVLLVRRAFDRLRLGHDLVVHNTGEAAVDWLAKSGEGVDLILLDLNLPGMSGHEVLRRIRQSKRRTPVVVLSASARESDVHDAYEAGANHYLVKPLGFEEFAELIRRWSDYWTMGRLPPR